MSEILEELQQNKKSSIGTLFILKIFAFIFLIVLFGIYVGNLLFGVNSLDVLLNVQNDKENLEKQVLQFKNKNALLQKEYFELKDLDPDYKRK
ncbi:MAG: septum formation initiator [Sulfurospirillum sp.]|nr:septum formation initiator [Sulfurospirillum sp.]